MSIVCLFYLLPGKVDSSIQASVEEEGLLLSGLAAQAHSIDSPVVTATVALVRMWNKNGTAWTPLHACMADNRDLA
jgi:hypothetical protein